MEQGGQAEGMSAVLARVQEITAQERGETQVGPSCYSSSERKVANRGNESDVRSKPLSRRRI